MQSPPNRHIAGAFQAPSGPYQQPYYSPYQQQSYASDQTGAGVPQSSAGQKDRQMTLFLCLFLGVIGVHRFYTGYTAIGIVQLVTLGGCGIWALVDLVSILTGSFTDANGQPLL